MAAADICQPSPPLKPHQRRRITVNGIVQGVGFRPFVYRQAIRHRLTGFVANTSHGVEIEVQGQPGDLEQFIDSLATQAPAQSLLAEFIVTLIPPCADSDFTIRLSDASGPVTTFISPDLSICQECLQELLDPHDRRYRYPFINCTHCGPRFTIIRDLPYDRPATAMAPFVMCPKS